MRFALVTLGSAGDLHPFLALGRALRRRGHEVWVLSQAPYEAAVRAEGLLFRPIATLDEHRRTLEHPLLWHRLHGFGVLWRHLAVPSIPRTVETLGQLAPVDDGQGPLTVLASPLAAGARFALDRWPAGIRLRSVYTAPMGLRSLDDPLFIGPFHCPSWVPRSIRSSLWAALDRWKLEPMARPALTAFQRQWATSPLPRSIFGDWIHAPDGGLALYPPWFAQVPAAWRARGVVQADHFPLFEPTAPRPAPAAVTDFCAAHRRYIVVYPGSAGGETQDFLERLMPACQRLGLAMLALQPQLGECFPSSSHARVPVLAARDIALGTVLARAAAFVHHGGIGSVAQGLHWRVPQLIVAGAYDQFENGARVEALGAGHWCPQWRASPARMDRLLHALTTQPREAVRPATVPVETPASAEQALDRLCEHLDPGS